MTRGEQAANYANAANGRSRNFLIRPFAALV